MASQTRRSGCNTTLPVPSLAYPTASLLNSSPRRALDSCPACSRCRRTFSSTTLRVLWAGLSIPICIASLPAVVFHPMAPAGFPAGLVSFCPCACYSSLPPSVPERSGKSLRLRQAPFLRLTREVQLRYPHEFRCYIAPLYETEWVVCAKPPFAGPQQVLDYVGRYAHRVAISNNRLLDIENDRVRFLWKDYRDNNRQKTMTLSADEFIRRFLIHVLPDGFQRIRYYGFLSNRHREGKLVLCRQLLGMPVVDPETAPGDQPSDYDFDELYEKLTGSSLRQCPICHEGRMVVVEILAPVVPEFIDTS